MKKTTKRRQANALVILNRQARKLAGLSVQEWNWSLKPWEREQWRQRVTGGVVRLQPSDALKALKALKGAR